MNREGMAGGPSLSHVPLNRRIGTAFFFFSYFFICPPAGFPAGSHLLTFSALHFHAPALESGLMPLDGPPRLSCGDMSTCLQLLILRPPPPVRYADYPEQGVEVRLVARGFTSGDLPPDQRCSKCSPVASFCRGFESFQSNK